MLNSLNVYHATLLYIWIVRTRNKLMKRFVVYNTQRGALWCSGYSTLAFGSIGHGFESEHRLFSHHSISLQQAEVTGVVLTGRFSSSPAVVHSTSYPPGKANRVAV